MTSTYPAGRTDRDRFILGRRDARPVHDPFTHQGVIVEAEPDATGRLLASATVFLTGRECAWRCVMCDLWRFTTDGDTPVTAIPTQLRRASDTMRLEGVVPDVWKLYNAGSFFDRRAIPPADDEAIVDIVGGAARVVVESHPALVGERVWSLRDRLQKAGTALEVAMGLETAHPGALDAINKGVSVDGFAAAAEALRREGVSLRVFLLVHPPFVPIEERQMWLQRSVDWATGCGASAVSLIPTRSGEGAMQALAAEGLYVAPTLSDLEQASAAALNIPERRAPGAGKGARPRMFADLWDLEQHSQCVHCFETRRARLVRQNLEQRVSDAVVCRHCAGQVAS